MESNTGDDKKLAKNQRSQRELVKYEDWVSFTSRQNPNPETKFETE